METTNKTPITVKAQINANVEKVWKKWTNPDDIIHWNHASDDWISPRAENDLRRGGQFNIRMEAKDGSTGFDFSGVYEKVMLHKEIDYVLGDGRKVRIIFSPVKNKTEVIETFDAENTNPVELQRQGWQSILDSFKKYTEAH
ncbi:MAG: SRPBCC family protein [Bacteroidales bacterium]|jgi:uncharacterized protein YndB with AHSA1/START domain